MTFDTTEYRYSYGKEPKGNGMWAFEVKGETVFFNGKYADAKKQCKKYVKEKYPDEYIFVKVLP